MLVLVGFCVSPLLRTSTQNWSHPPHPQMCSNYVQAPTTHTHRPRCVHKLIRFKIVRCTCAERERQCCACVCTCSCSSPRGSNGRTDTLPASLVAHKTKAYTSQPKHPLRCADHNQHSTWCASILLERFTDVGIKEPTQSRISARAREGEFKINGKNWFDSLNTASSKEHHHHSCAPWHYGVVISSKQDQGLLFIFCAVPLRDRTKRRVKWWLFCARQ